MREYREPGELGRLLRIFRSRHGRERPPKGMSLAELARRSRCSISYLSRLESSERVRPSREVVLAIAVALELTWRQTNALLDAAFPQFPPFDGGDAGYSGHGRDLPPES